jgi:hypothetical protein
MPSPTDHSRALRYRQLALAEQDRTNAAILNRIAEEAERGVLCIAAPAPLRPATQISASDR